MVCIGEGGYGLGTLPSEFGYMPYMVVVILLFLILIVVILLPHKNNLLFLKTFRIENMHDR